MHWNAKTAVTATTLIVVIVVTLVWVLGSPKLMESRIDSAVPSSDTAIVDQGSGNIAAERSNADSSLAAPETPVVSSVGGSSATSAVAQMGGLRVRAMKAGAPAPSTEIWVGDRNSASSLLLSRWESSPNEGAWLQTSRMDGYAEFADVPTRTPLLIASRTIGGQWVAEAQEFVVIEGRWTEHSIEIAPGGAVIGRLLDESGRALSGRELVLAPNPSGGDRYLAATEPLSVSSYTDATGNFQFSGLTNGQWIVGCRNQRDEWSEAWREAPDSFGRCFEISDSRPQAHLTLRASCGLLIEGRIECSGRPVEEPIWVVVTDDSGHRFGAPSASGRFSIGPLQRGGYSLQSFGSALCRFRESEVVRVSAGERDIVLSLAVGLDVVVVPILEPRPTAAESMQVLVARPDGGGSDFVPRVISGVSDRFIVSGLPDGPVDVVVKSSSGRIGVVPNVIMTKGLTSPLEVPVVLAQAANLKVQNTCSKWVEFSVTSSGSLIERGWACPQAMTEVWIPRGAFVLESSTEGVRVRGESQRAALGRSTSVFIEASD